MKSLLLALVTLALTLNGLGLDLVKCGSVKVENASTLNQLKGSRSGRFKIVKSKPDGTSLFYFPSAGIHAAIKPFEAAMVWRAIQTFSVKTTNSVEEVFENGTPVLVYTVLAKTTNIVSWPDVVFGSLSSKGYIDVVSTTITDSFQEFKITNGVESSSDPKTSLVSSNSIVGKFNSGGVLLDKVDITDFLQIDRFPLGFYSFDDPNIMRPLEVRNRLVLPKLNGDSIDFYLVTDPDLFPDTALGAPRVEGGSATFNVTTGSEEPVEIQASDDLKIWKRLKTLEDANGRSVTVPADAAQGFLRAVEK